MPEAFASHYSFQKTVSLERLGSRIPLRYFIPPASRGANGNRSFRSLRFSSESAFQVVIRYEVQTSENSLVRKAQRSAHCVLHEPWKAKVDLIMSEAPFALTRRRSISSLKIAGTRAWCKPQTPLKLISGKPSYSVVLREQMCGWGTSRFILGKPKDFVSLSTVK